MWSVTGFQRNNPSINQEKTYEERDKKPEYKYNCQIDSCGASNTFKRVVTMMMNSRKFSFHDK
jgi:hypothetical protein